MKHWLLASPCTTIIMHYKLYSAFETLTQFQDLDYKRNLQNACLNTNLKMTYFLSYLHYVIYDVMHHA